MQAENEIARQSVLFAVALKGLAALAVDAARGADPQTAVGVFQQRADLRTIQRIADVDAFTDHAVFPVDQTGGIHADPDAAVLGRRQTENGIVFQTGMVLDGADAFIGITVQPARGADHQTAVGGFGDGAYVVVGQSLVIVEGDERRIGETHQSGVGAGPQIAFAVAVQGTDPVVGQPVLGIKRFQTARAHAQDAAVDRADPEVGLFIDAQADHRLVGKSGHRFEFAIAHGVQAVMCADEKAAFRRLQHRVHGAVRQALRFVEGLQTAVLDTRHAVGGADPDRFAAIHVNRIQAFVGQPVFRVVGADLAIRPDTRQALAFMRHPDRALGVFDGGHGFILRQSVLLAVGFPAAAITDRHATA